MALVIPRLSFRMDFKLLKIPSIIQCLPHLHRSSIPRHHLSKLLHKIPFLDLNSFMLNPLYQTIHPHHVGLTPCLNPHANSLTKFLLTFDHRNIGPNMQALLRRIDLYTQLTITLQ